jgi:CheY-like chemotaxis protein
VLLVDDNLDNHYAVKFILKELGYRSIFARDGIEGTEKADHELPDLILMDLMMPGMDGYRATKKIRKKKSGRDIPIIAMTAKTVQEDKKRAIKAGCDDYLLKPFTLEQISQKLKKWLG